MDPTDCLDVLAQQPGLQIYTQICLCFPVNDDTSHPKIIDTLTSGLERLRLSFPWVAGNVINEGSSDGNTGIFKIVPSGKTSQLIVKDVRDNTLVPTMSALRRANFPISMLDESIFAPRKTLGDEDAQEIFLVQATFIIGGLVLTFVAKHNTMDMTGQGQVIDLFAKACCNEPFTSEELSSGNLARRDIIPLLEDSYTPGPELDNQLAKPNSTYGAAGGLVAPNSRWANFTFARSSLATLKTIATKSITSPIAFVSTDDILSAFVWQSIMRVRAPRLDFKVDAKFARAIDVRRYLDIPQTYPGLLQNMTYHQYPLEKLIEEPLGAIASALRSPLEPKSSILGLQTRALATYLSRSPDKSIISFTARLDLSVDIMLSSWAKLDCYELDFNLGLGKPESVRRPQFYPVESLLYLLPKTLDGDITVTMCLRDEDMEKLKTDVEFGRYAKHDG